MGHYLISHVMLFHDGLVINLASLCYKCECIINSCNVADFLSTPNLF